MAAYLIRMQKWVFVFVAVCLMSSSVAVAGEQELAGFDTNGDGKITMSEIMQHIRPVVKKGFDAMDRNHDGVLSDKDFDDISEGMHKLEDWLNEVLRPFIDSETESVESQEF